MKRQQTSNTNVDLSIFSKQQKPYFKRKLLAFLKKAIKSRLIHISFIRQTKSSPVLKIGFQSPIVFLMIPNPK